MAFLYHLCADDFRGTRLLPLNDLRTAHPDVYDRERLKWEGRESVLEWEVPHLDMPWGDTVNLAALDPARLVEARRRLGIPFSRLLERRVVRIPVERIADKAAVVYNPRSHSLNSRPGEDAPATPPAREFGPFDLDTYEELAEVPDRHLDYLIEQRDARRPALGFVFIRHVLVAGPVDIGGIPQDPI